MPGIAVLGGAGFIGSHIVDELLATGQRDVLVLDDLSEGSLDNLGRWKGDPRLEFVRGDIRDFSTVRRALDGKTAVFHLAACSRIQPSITDPSIAWTSNLLGTGNVLEACRLGGVKRVVYSASSSAYGRLTTMPAREDCPTDCLNPYSLSKKVGEDMMDMYRELYGLSTVSLRYFNVYGPRHQEQGSYATVVAIFRRQARLGQPLTIVGDGEQRRDFTFVGDVVRANMMAMMDRTVSGVINIGFGKNFSINEVAELVAPGHPTVNLPPRLGEARLTLADTSKARELMGWRPSVSLEDGLQVLQQYESVNGFRSPIVVVG